jgi:hypothetical protein
LITNENNPSVRIVIGNESNFRIGFTKVLRKLITKATIKAAVVPLTLISLRN